MAQKLFTIHESQNMPRELWDRFVACTRAEGLPLGAVLARLIADYLNEQERSRHDAPDQSRRPE